MRYYIIPDPTITRYNGRTGILIYDEVARMSKFVYSTYIDKVLVRDGNLRVIKLLPSKISVIVYDDSEVGMHETTRTLQNRRPKHNIVLVYYDYLRKRFITQEQSRKGNARIHPTSVETLMIDAAVATPQGDGEYSEDVSVALSPVSRTEKLRFVGQITNIRPIAYDKRVFKRVRSELVARRGSALAYDISSYTFTFDRELVHFPLEDLDFETYLLQLKESTQFRQAYISPEMADRIASLGRSNQGKLTKFLNENGISLEIATHYFAWLKGDAPNLASVYNEEMLYPVITDRSDDAFHRGHMIRNASELLAHRNDTVISHYGNITAFRFQFRLDKHPDENLEMFPVAAPLTTDIFINDIVKRIFTNRLPAHNIVKFTVKQRCLLSFLYPDEACGGTRRSSSMTNIHLYSATVDFLTKRVVLHGLAASGQYADGRDDRVGAEYEISSSSSISESDGEDQVKAQGHEQEYNPLTAERSRAGRLRVFSFDAHNFYNVFASHYRYPERYADTPYIKIDPSRVRGEAVASSSEFVFDMFNSMKFKGDPALRELVSTQADVMLQNEVEVSAHYLSSIVGTTEGDTEENFAKKIAAARDVPLRYTRVVPVSLARTVFAITSELKLSSFEDKLAIVSRSVDKQCVLCGLQISIVFLEAFKTTTGQSRPTIVSIENFARRKGFTVFDKNNIPEFVAVATNNTVKCILYNEKMEVIGQSSGDFSNIQPEQIVRLMLFGNHAYYIYLLPTNFVETTLPPSEQSETGSVEHRFAHLVPTLPPPPPPPQPYRVVIYFDLETVNGNQALPYSYAYLRDDGVGWKPKSDEVPASAATGSVSSVDPDGSVEALEADGTAASPVELDGTAAPDRSVDPVGSVEADGVRAEYYFHPGVLDEYVVLEHFINSIFDSLTLNPPTAGLITVVFKAWNGARFDYRLLIPYLLSLPTTTTINFPGLTLTMNMKYWVLKYTHQTYTESSRSVKREFRLVLSDPKLFTPGLSLTQAVRKFSKLTPALFQGIVLEKEEFSHSEIQERFESTGRTSVPLTENEKAKARSYNIQDVVLLRAMCLSLNTVFPDSMFARSIPGYAFNLLKESSESEDMLQGDFYGNAIIRKAILGGRVEAFRGAFCTQGKVDKYHNLVYREDEHPLYMLDVNALYPFACIGKPLPIYRQTPLTDPRRSPYFILNDPAKYPTPATILKWIREGTMFITNMTRIGYTPLAQSLPPLIPRRYKERTTKKGIQLRTKLTVIDWNNWATNDYVCSNIIAILAKRRVIDLNNCVFGETIVFRESGPILTDFMAQRRDDRIRAKLEKNDAVAQFNKDVSNSLIGKLMQRKPTTEDKFLEDGKTYREYDLIETFPYSDEEGRMHDRALARFNISEKVFDPVPCQLGCFVLSYAREYMWDTFLRHCGKLGERYFYTDTDSLLVSKEMYDSFVARGLMHDTDYGKLKVEIVAVEALIHAKKTYLLIDENGHSKFSLKGFSHQITSFKTIHSSGKPADHILSNPIPLEPTPSEGSDEEAEETEETEEHTEEQQPPAAEKDPDGRNPHIIHYESAQKITDRLFANLMDDSISTVAIDTVGFQGFKTFAQTRMLKRLK
jgi:hypothetical protein